VLSVLTASEAADLGLTPDADGNVTLIDILQSTDHVRTIRRTWACFTKWTTTTRLDDGGTDIADFELKRPRLASILYTAVNERDTFWLHRFDKQGNWQAYCIRPSTKAAAPESDLSRQPAPASTEIVTRLGLDAATDLRPERVGPVDAGRQRPQSGGPPMAAGMRWAEEVRPREIKPRRFRSGWQGFSSHVHGVERIGPVPGGANDGEDRAPPVCTTFGQS